MVPVLAVLLLAGGKQANAQGFSAYFGMGSAIDSSATNSGCPSGHIDDPFNNSGTVSCIAASNMGGVFGIFGSDVMITPHLGFNGEYSFRFAQSHYADSTAQGPITLNARPAFYDFNAVF